MSELIYEHRFNDGTVLAIPAMFRFPWLGAGNGWHWRDSNGRLISLHLLREYSVSRHNGHDRDSEYADEWECCCAVALAWWRDAAEAYNRERSMICEGLHAASVTTEEYNKAFSVATRAWQKHVDAAEAWASEMRRCG